MKHYAKKGNVRFSDLIFLDIDFKYPHSWSHMAFCILIEPSRAIGGQTHRKRPRSVRPLHPGEKQSSCQAVLWASLLLSPKGSMLMENQPLCAFYIQLLWAPRIEQGGVVASRYAVLCCGLSMGPAEAVHGWENRHGLPWWGQMFWQREVMTASESIHWKIR